MKKIGVIIATHNGKKLISNALESILNQSYKNFKIVVCDDGSTDDTYEYLINKYDNNKKIQIIKNKEKKGLAFSLNECIKECNDCEYIARMDDDDYSYSNRFEEQIKFLNENDNISFVGSNIIIYDGKKEIKEKKYIDFPKKKDLIWNSPFVHPSIMLRKEDLLKANCYRVSKETMRGQDYDLWMRMYSMGMKGANIQKTLFRYTENIGTSKKRTFKVRLGECKVRLIGYKKMKVNIIYYIFVLKPIVSYFKDLFRIK